MRFVRSGVALAGLVAGAVTAAACQAPTPLAVGTKAPDFTLPSATKAGAGPKVKLSDFAGKTVVLAFFFKVRTPG